MTKSSASIANKQRTNGGFLSHLLFLLWYRHAHSESLKTFFLKAVNDISRSPKEQLLQLLSHYLSNHIEINDIDIPLPDTHSNTFIPFQVFIIYQSHSCLYFVLFSKLKPIAYDPNFSRAASLFCLMSGLFLPGIHKYKLVACSFFDSDTKKSVCIK